jgi:hypothetical protein
MSTFYFFTLLVCWSAGVLASELSADETKLLQSFWGEWTNQRGDVQFYYSPNTFVGSNTKHCSVSKLEILSLNTHTKTIVARIASDKGQAASDFKLEFTENEKIALLSNRSKLLAQVGALSLPNQDTKEMSLDELPFTTGSPMAKISDRTHPSLVCNVEKSTKLKRENSSHKTRSMSKR